MNPFLVYAMPRSRTAWLSCAMTRGDVICDHDTISPADNFAESLEKMWRSRFKYHGVVDTGILFDPKCAPDQAPGVSKALIWREKNDVVESLLKFMPAIGADMGKLMLQIDAGYRVMEAMKGDILTIKYEDMDDLGALKELTAHLCPNLPFDRDRWKHMIPMHVNIHAGKWLEVHGHPVRNPFCW